MLFTKVTDELYSHGNTDTFLVPRLSIDLFSVLMLLNVYQAKDIDFYRQKNKRIKITESTIFSCVSSSMIDKMSR